MGDAARILDLVDTAVSDGIAAGVGHLAAEDDRLDGRCVRIRGERKINFASFSYLGLELDPRLKRGAIDAVERYGTQFSSSRAYVSAPLYAELEALLDRILGGFALVTPSTTLAHLSALPVLIGEKDAAILDQQVHQSVRLATTQLRAQGTHLEFVRHGMLEALDQRIRALSQTHRRVWYLADGVYSMHGDFAPTAALRWLLARHPRLHLYVDDAHGMGWCGRHGRGFALEELPARERVVVAVSLNKAFAAGGGALSFPNEELRRKVKACGLPMIFAGPVQPPMLGAAVASAKIHLSDEIERLQRELRERIRFANRVAEELDLPLVSRCEVPIRYLGLGLPRVAHDTARHLLDRGLLVNSAVFPAVKARGAGVRFALTRHHSLEDIRSLLEAVADYLPRTLAAHRASRDEIDSAFGLKREPRRRTAAAAPACSGLSCQQETTIRALDADEWDALLGSRGCFGWQGLAFLESAFSGNPRPEDNWGFHYYVVRDAQRRPVLATFLTDALWKEDMLAPESVSAFVEARRTDAPYFLTSRVLAMGSLLSEGDHLYLDRAADWRSALELLLTAVEQERGAREAQAVVLRDFRDGDRELAGFLVDAGFVKTALPDSMVLEIDWRDREGFLRRLSKRARKFQREVVLPQENAYDVRVLRGDPDALSDAEWAHLHHLYSNVQGRSLALNTFALPEHLLRRMMEFSAWEILLLTLRPEFGGDPGAPPQGFVASYAGPGQYSPVLAGLDYRYIQSHSLYRQLLFQALCRAEALGAKRIHFGIGSELEKSRFGARREKRVMYVQSADHYQHDVLSLVAADANLRAAG